MSNNTEQQLREEAFRKEFILPASKEAYPEKKLLDWENMNKQYAFEKGALWMRKQSLSELEEAKKSMYTREQVEKMLGESIDWAQGTLNVSMNLAEMKQFEADKQTTISKILNPDKDGK